MNITFRIFVCSLVLFAIVSCAELSEPQYHVAFVNLSENEVKLRDEHVYVPKNIYSVRPFYKESCSSEFFDREGVKMLSLEIFFEDGNRTKFGIEQIEQYNADIDKYPFIYITPSNQVLVGRIPDALLGACTDMDNILNKPKYKY